MPEHPEQQRIFETGQGIAGSRHPDFFRPASGTEPEQGNARPGSSRPWSGCGTDAFTEADQRFLRQRKGFRAVVPDGTDLAHKG